MSLLENSRGVAEPDSGHTSRASRNAATHSFQAPEPEPPPERIPRAARVLALAHKWRTLIRSGAVKNQAELARLVGVSRARVTQVMGLLWLPPDVQEAVLFGEIEVDERGLRERAAEALWGAAGAR